MRRFSKAVALAAALAVAVWASECAEPASANSSSVASRVSSPVATSTTRTDSVAAPPSGLILDSIAAPLIAVSCNDRLATAYTGPLIRVRRSSDNAETDIGYTGGNVLDRTALTTHCGAADCFVAVEYDQSGNARNMTQTTAANQPQIVTGGVINTSGGNVVMTNIASNSADGLQRADAGGLTGNHDLTMFWLGKSPTIAGQTAMQRIGDSDGYTLGHNGANVDTTWGAIGDNVWTTSTGTAYRYAITTYSATTHGDAVIENGVTLTISGSYSTGTLAMANTQYRTGYAFCASQWSTDMVWNSILSGGDQTTLNAWAETRRTS